MNGGVYTSGKHRDWRNNSELLAHTKPAIQGRCAAAVLYDGGTTVAGAAVSVAAMSISSCLASAGP